MKAALEAWLTRRWYGGVEPGLALRLAARIYGALARRRQMQEQQRVTVPVIVIGNFTAGGTGKTPLAIALVKELLARGFQPGIVSRGHGRHSGGALRVSSQTPAALAGDEPTLMFEKTQVPVLVDSDRVAAAREAILAGCDVVIADDGLQHRRLYRDLEIEVVDGERAYGNGLLLPAGPLREPPRPCDFRVVNGAGADNGQWPMRLRMTDAVSLTDPAVKRPLVDFAGRRVHAFAAIGNPDRFFGALRSLGLDVVSHPFEDHHDYREADFTGFDGPMLMTEKDAVKCRRFGLTGAWAVPVEAELPAAFYEAIEERLKRAHD